MPMRLKWKAAWKYADTVELCYNAGVPVLGHIGLTPQSVNQDRRLPDSG